MDSEIKRLLKLDAIKGFQLLDSEKKKLEEWKASQKRVVIEPKKEKIPKGHMKGEMGSNGVSTLINKKDLGAKVEEPKLVKNVVKPEDKNTGEIAE